MKKNVFMILLSFFLFMTSCTSLSSSQGNDEINNSQISNKKSNEDETKAYENSSDIKLENEVKEIPFRILNADGSISNDNAVYESNYFVDDKYDAFVITNKDALTKYESGFPNFDGDVNGLINTIDFSNHDLLLINNYESYTSVQHVTIFTFIQQTNDVLECYLTKNSHWAGDDAMEKRDFMILVSKLDSTTINKLELHMTISLNPYVSESDILFL